MEKSSEPNPDEALKSHILDFIRTGGPLDPELLQELARGNYSTILGGLLAEQSIDLKDEAIKKRWSQLMMLASKPDIFDGLQSITRKTQR